MKQLIEDVLKCIGCYSVEATELILGVIAQESSFGRYRRQLGNGPALGIVQMEPATFQDIINNFLVYHRDLGDKILKCAGLDHFDPEDLVNNDRLAIAMCRMQFWRGPTRIPSDLQGQAELWKKYYNTPLGAGTVKEYINNYHRYVLNS